MVIKRGLFFLLIFMVAAVGCETAVSPTPTVIGPTAAALATEPPTSTAPAPPATATPTITSTATQTAAATATATPVPPTPTIAGLIGPDTFPPDVNPLTGETVRDPTVLQRRPLAVKISNAPPLVRPQAGLNSADLVFEHYAEGGYTRFTAVFYSQDVETVGSIRSARLVDLEIPVMFDAAFAYSGSVGPIREMLRDSTFFERIISPDFAHGGFERRDDLDRPFVHRLFTNTYNLRYILEQRGQDVPPTFANTMAFRAAPLAQGEPAQRIELHYLSTNATWFYSNGRYLRWTDGEEHRDANTGEQLSFKNVVIIAANHVETDILEDTGGNRSIQIQIWGEGPVSLFRDGQRFNGRWQRDTPEKMLTFVDHDGQILPLAPGNTFFQLVPLGFDQLYVTP